MRIDTADLNMPSGFYPVNFDAYSTTLEESKVSFSIDMGGVTLHYGTRYSSPIWLMENPTGLYGVWIEEDADRRCLH
jgi:hypothetical protein